MIAVTAHAIERYHERVRPGITRRQAKRELELLVQDAKVTLEQPDWLVLSDPVDAFAEVSDGIVLICAVTPDGLCAVSCMARGSMSDVARAARNGARRRRRARVRARAEKWRDKGSFRALEKAQATRRRRRRRSAA